MHAAGRKTFKGDNFRQFGNVIEIENKTTTEKTPANSVSRDIFVVLL